MSRFDYVKYDGQSSALQSAFKKQFENLEAMVEYALKPRNPGALMPSQAQSLVLTKLEEAYMWVGKAIRDIQVQQSPAEPQEERRNG